MSLQAEHSRLKSCNKLAVMLRRADPIIFFLFIAPDFNKAIISKVLSEPPITRMIVLEGSRHIYCVKYAPEYNAHGPKDDKRSF